MDGKTMEVYVHIPFCIRKCAYCDFLSGPADAKVQEQYLNALLHEIETFPGGEVSTVFFGGGTPSVLPPEWIRKIMDTIGERFRILPDAEVTIECNPGTADRQKLRQYREAGINRISLGLQSADNKELALLGRIHTWETFLRTYEDAGAVGFSNRNVDLMSALPGQTLSSWEQTLKQVLELRPEHISAYSLIVEEGTPFYERYHEDEERRMRGERPVFLPSEEDERRMYERTEELLLEAGMYRYEISNYALPDRECRHNIGYWTGVEYVGFGLGASSLLNHTRYKNTEKMDAYLRWYGEDPGFAPEKLREEDPAVRKLREADPAAGAVREAEPLTGPDEMEEFMFLGLRMMRGVSEAEFAHRFGQQLTDVYGEVLKRLIGQGLLAREQGFVSLTRAGIDVSNPVLAEFLLER